MLGQKLKHDYMNLQLNYMCILETYEEYLYAYLREKKCILCF